MELVEEDVDLPSPGQKYINHEITRTMFLNNRPSSEHKIQTKLLLANPYANIEGQRIVVIPQQCKQRRTL